MHCAHCDIDIGQPPWGQRVCELCLRVIEGGLICSDCHRVTYHPVGEQCPACHTADEWLAEMGPKWEAEAATEEYFRELERVEGELDYAREMGWIEDPDVADSLARLIAEGPPTLADFLAGSQGTSVEPPITP